MGLIIGLGSGRCGTVSLARLLHAQPESVCFHEINPAGSAWSGAERTVLEMCEQFSDILSGSRREVTIDTTSPNRALPREKLEGLATVRSIGDVASYYLPYAEMIIERYPDVRMPCLRRDREETVASFVTKMEVPRSRRQKLANMLSLLTFRRPPYPTHRNHWAHNDGSRYVIDEKWDKCFPSFPSRDLAAALRRYWDFYYEKAESLMDRYPENVRIFTTGDLNSPAGQSGILSFCGLCRTTGFLEIKENSS